MSFKREIFVDNFAGGGGASTGIEMAIGRSVNIAINHDPDAIAMHTVNHPDSKHYCEDVWHVDPHEACQGRPVALAWFSPDCKHFSRAKGGKPVDKNIRGLAWVALRWAATVRPRVIMLENVPEIQTWGPLDKKGKPIKEKAGHTFRSFIYQMEQCGYKAEYRELKSCDYGAPTTRKRFYMIARCDGQPILWPEPTHGDRHSKAVKEGRLKPYRTAAECIDWSIPTQSIFNRKRPLVENTMKRIAKGIIRYVIENPEPFIVVVNHGGEGFRGQRIHEPLQTITAKHGYSLVAPALIQYHGEKRKNEARIKGPLHTITTIDHNGLVAAHVIKMKGTNIGHPMDEPLQTITAGGLHFGEVLAFLTKYYGDIKGSFAQRVDEPLHTVTTRDRFGLVTVHGDDYIITDIHMRMLQPHELFAAMGFPKDYIIDRDTQGNPFPKSKQVARCGNAVTPQVPEALVRANLPEHCKKEDEVA